MTILDELQNVDVEKVIRRDLGPLSLSEVEREIRNTLSVLIALLESPPGETPRSVLNEMNQRASSFKNNWERALRLEAKQHDFATNRANTIEEFRRTWEEVGEHRGHALAQQIGDLKGLPEKARLVLEQTLVVKKEAESAAKAAKGAAELAAVSNLASAYQEEANTFKWRSWVWAVISLLAAGGGTVVMYIFVQESLKTQTFTLPQALLRAVVIAVIFGAFHLCLRTYQAYCHLEVVNRHRVNIGRTYEAFKEAQPTDKAKEVMAALTAEHMLAFGKSGLLPRDLSVQSPVSGASELVRAVMGPKET